MSLEGAQPLLRCVMFSDITYVVVSTSYEFCDLSKLYSAIIVIIPKHKCQVFKIKLARREYAIRRTEGMRISRSLFSLDDRPALQE